MNSQDYASMLMDEDCQLRPQEPAQLLQEEDEEQTSKRKRVKMSRDTNSMLTKLLSTSTEVPQNRDVQLPQHPVQFKELQSLTVNKLPTGTYYYQDQHPYTIFKDPNILPTYRPQAPRSIPPQLHSQVHRHRALTAPPVLNREPHQPSFKLLEDRPCYLYCSELPVITATVYDPQTGQIREIHPQSTQHSSNIGTQASIARF